MRPPFTFLRIWDRFLHYVDVVVFSFVIVAGLVVGVFDRLLGRTRR